MPGNWKIVPPVFLISVVIVIYSLFIWSFHKFLAKRDVLGLNLSQYNKYKHPFMIKLVAIFWYIIEFIIIGPVMIFIWFSVFSIFIILLAKEIEIGIVILISAGLVSSVRILSYFNEGLARDLAKLVPFTLIAVFLTTPGFWDVGTNLERILQIPQFFNEGIYYLFFIFGMEAILRIFFLPLQIAVSLKEDEENNNSERKKK